MQGFWVRNCCVWAIPCGETQKVVPLTYKMCSLSASIGRTIYSLYQNKPFKSQPESFFEIKKNNAARKT